MDIQQRIREVATVENADRYSREPEKFLFCLELLGNISAHHPKAEEWVNALEDDFDSLNNHGLTLEEMAEQRRQESEAEKANEYALEGVTNY